MRSAGLDPVTRGWITQRARESPEGLSSWIADKFGITRRTANLWLATIVAQGFLKATGTTHKVYSIGPNVEFSFFVPVVGLDENQLWLDRILPWLDAIPDNVIRICHHGFTEMVNNACDHSEGKELWVRLRVDASVVEMIVDDDGVGIFNKVQRALNLPDPRLSLLELAKGRFTTDPKNHSGEGIFFSSRMFDDFAIHADGLIFSHQDGTKFDYLFEGEQAEKGTMVVMRIARNSTRVPNDVFFQFAAPDEFTFDRTIVPMKLARLGNENLVSRSQAKRVILRFDRFSFVDLDFNGIPTIGQAFADEIFRVYAKAHPEIKLSYSNCVPEVELMIRRALAHVE
ncbi:MAG: DUF4325 domain-containing protein [Betaproteobacteria bacterium]|nr:MAG: DUF4325 domain-containing protein [Betaproteobacteria bacterium]TAG48637.1 MAG: DUF4325 domain-containing protein [Betaproteobacteria bacterium]